MNNHQENEKLMSNDINPNPQNVNRLKLTSRDMDLIISSGSVPLYDHSRRAVAVRDISIFDDPDPRRSIETLVDALYLLPTGEYYHGLPVLAWRVGGQA